MRYYGDDCKVNPLLDLGQLNQSLHAAYTPWVRNNYHYRDFIPAAEHTATMAYLEHAQAGAPQVLEPATFRPLALATPRDRTCGSPPVRLYDELSALSPEIDLTVLDGVMAPLLANWIFQGWHARDFVQAIKDCAAGIHYDHQLSASLGGQGGGRDALRFLTEPYAD